MSKAILSLSAALALLVALRASVAYGVPTPAPLPPPTPSASISAPFGAIGSLERDRKTPPAAFDKYLNDRDPAVQARAALALGRLGNPAANTTLVGVLASPRRADQVRAAAAFALGLLASPDSVDALSTAARHDAPSVAAAAEIALGRIGGPTVVDLLTQLLLSSSDAGVRAQAAVGLGTAALPGAPAIDYAHRDTAASALASSILTEHDQEVRWREAWALGRAFYQNQAPTLRRLLGDDQELVRLYAVVGLRKLGDRKYALPVRLEANDPSWRVRVEVHNALVAFRDPTTVNLKPPPVPKEDLEQPQPMPSGAPFGDHPQVAIVTNKGVIVLELFPDEAPYSVDNFLSLVDRGFYNGLTYFRVISDFVVQGGDPKNTGDGGPGYSIPSERNPVEQLTGIISYGLDYDSKTNTPLFDSAGSQYYITQSPQLHLDRGFTVFGRVVKGMAVVDAIAPQPDAPRPAGIGPPDVAKKLYRCQPVSAQTAQVEEELRTAEIGYDAR